MNAINTTLYTLALYCHYCVLMNAFNTTLYTLALYSVLMNAFNTTLYTLALYCHYCVLMNAFNTTLYTLALYCHYCVLLINQQECFFEENDKLNIKLNNRKRLRTVQMCTVLFLGETVHIFTDRNRVLFLFNFMVNMPFPPKKTFLPINRLLGFCYRFKSLNKLMWVWQYWIRFPANRNQIVQFIPLSTFWLQIKIS